MTEFKVGDLVTDKDGGPTRPETTGEIVSIAGDLGRAMARKYIVKWSQGHTTLMQARALRLVDGEA